MQRRTTITELFSTFVQFSDDRFERWMRDRQLYHSIETYLAKKSRASQSEKFWALYWYKLWQAQTHLRAAAHLNAYLQEPCYWAIKSITQRFVSVPWTLADGFQGVIAHADRILKGYRPDYGSDLKAYARTAFSNLIRDQLRQQGDAYICSDWGLLRRLSQAQLQRSLLVAGFNDVKSHLLAWECFKAIYIPNPQRSVRALPSPSLEQFARMTKRYNQLRLNLSSTPSQSLQPSQPSQHPPLTVDALVESLNQSVQAARAYLAPAVASLDQPQFAPDTKTPLDDLSSEDTPMELLLTAEVYAERQQRIDQIEAVLKLAITALAPADQTLLRLYYQEASTQNAIAHQLQIQQYQVSRQLSRVRQQLLRTVAQWSQETLHISVDSNVLKSMSDVIHEWLQQHYRPEIACLDELDI